MDRSAGLLLAIALLGACAQRTASPPADSEQPCSTDGLRPFTGYRVGDISSALEHTEVERDEFAKSTKIRSPWIVLGAGLCRFEPYTAFRLRGFVYDDGEENHQVYVGEQLRGDQRVFYDYALDLDGKRYRVVRTYTDAECRSYADCIAAYDVAVYVAARDLEARAGSGYSLSLRGGADHERVVTVPPEVVRAYLAHLWETRAKHQWPKRK